MITQNVLKTITHIEQDLLALKIQLYPETLKHSEIPSTYAEKALLDEIKVTRANIWNGRYDKKIKRSKQA